MENNLNSLVEQLSLLNQSEVSDLKSLLELKWGMKVEIIAAEPVMHQKVDVVEKTEFTVILTGFAPDKRVSVIKTIREVTGLGLAESKTLVESSAAEPKEVKVGIPQDQADDIKTKLEASGATIKVV